MKSPVRPDLITESTVRRQAPGTAMKNLHQQIDRLLPFESSAVNSSRAAQQLLLPLSDLLGIQFKMLQQFCQSLLLTQATKDIFAVKTGLNTRRIHNPDEFLMMSSHPGTFALSKKNNNELRTLSHLSIQIYKYLLIQKV